ncbi:hypothetical protein Mgra_00006414 [Meloidogyne graminicola]|uniref:Uncharacterized protein n=1 Tax=Meloidogyne graminicola TaxID=189291 RepID=A0A8S9ZMB1_9BILA|nr:hypothetical protein Mgra_00009803 [Meloidogyne graminicola]KAF7634236.1 hypothetical protein Mgra_00006414 [Meloidogyne graminicola]
MIILKDGFYSSLGLYPSACWLQILLNFNGKIIMYLYVFI